MLARDITTACNSCSQWIKLAAQWDDTSKKGLTFANKLVNLHTQSQYVGRAYIGCLDDCDSVSEQIEGQIHREFATTYKKLEGVMKELEDLIDLMGNTTSTLNQLLLRMATNSIFTQSDDAREEMFAQAADAMLQKHTQDAKVKRRIVDDIVYKKPTTTLHLYLVTWMLSPFIDFTVASHLEMFGIVLDKCQGKEARNQRESDIYA